MSEPPTKRALPGTKRRAESDLQEMKAAARKAQGRLRKGHGGDRDAFSTAFAKLQGWELAGRLLQKHTQTAALCASLLALAAPAAPAAPPAAAAATNTTIAPAAVPSPPVPRRRLTPPADSGARRLLHPHALQLLLETLGGCGEPRTQRLYLGELAALLELDGPSVEALLDSEWLAWLAALLRAAAAAQPPSEVAALEAQIVSFASAALLYDMTHSAASRARERLGRLLELPADGGGERLQLGVARAPLSL